MNYKEKLDEIKALVFGKVEEETPAPVEEVKLEEEVKEEAAEPAEAPAESYVTLSQFNELKEDTKKFMESVTEMLSSAMEMINATEKNTVPVEASKEKEVEVKEEVELAAEPVTHNPELATREKEIKVKIGGGAKKTTADRAFDAWINSISE